MLPARRACPSELNARAQAIFPPLRELWVSGDIQTAPAIAIVGTRRPSPDAARFSQALAFAVARAGAIVVSGGAVGIDACAHRGALEARGRTWVIAATGHAHCYPAEHAALFDEVREGGGALLWPFPPETRARRHNFLLRNRLLAAVSERVVVVQAGLPSGAMNAAHWAQRLERELWVVTAPPWLAGFEGCAMLVEQGRAKPLVSVERFLASCGLEAGLAATPGEAATLPLPWQNARGRALDADEAAVLAEMASEARHIDELARRAGLDAGRVASAILTLALENVVVEGPGGFYRRNLR